MMDCEDQVEMRMAKNLETGREENAARGGTKLRSTEVQLESVCFAAGPTPENCKGGTTIEGRCG